MADETEDIPDAQFKAQGTNHSTAPSSSRSTLGRHENVSASHPKALPSQSPPATTSSTPLANDENQTMTTASLATSSQVGQASTAMDSNGPSPYGTRSRNRTGNARPNYAEDRDLEEYDWNSTKRSQNLLTPAMPTQTQTVESEKSSGVNTRRSSTTALGMGGGGGGKVGAATAPKEHIPGMSSFSITPEATVPPAPPSKKRKAPGGGHVNANGTITSTHGSNQSRKQANLPVVTASFRETNMMSFDDSQGYLKHGKLKADDGTLLGIDDHVYLVCEPPGEPYYLARIMEFLHPDNDRSLPVDSIRVNWYYRPRDINRKVTDTRLVFATMHSDTCPLTSLRGKCQITHRSAIMDLDEYRKTKDNFWYDKMFDRYIHRFYEVIPTSHVINVPERVKRVLDARWKYVIVEIGRGKELTSAIKSCKRCSGYCASNDSVDCAMCKTTYHMNCVQPPLLKKPARGFGWSCGPCSRRQERKLEARNTPLVGDKALEAEEEEWLEEEDDHGQATNAGDEDGTPGSDHQGSSSKPATAEQIAQAKMWPYRYLGIHCRVEDALDFDDRIYPRASSRLGPKHQANVHVWHGKPVQYVKPAESRRKYVKGGAPKNAKTGKETVTEVENEKTAKEKRPKWVMDQPAGYVARGEDYPNGDPRNTAKLQFRLPQVGEPSSRGMDDRAKCALNAGDREGIIDRYMTQAKNLADTLGVAKHSTNFLDKALELLYAHNYCAEPALAELSTLNRRRDLKELDFSKEDIKRFEEGVARHGSEHRRISKYVGKSQKLSEIIRFYYMWKKSPNGRRIWGSHESRKGKKAARQTDSKLVDDVADDVDDSAFDNAKAASRKRGFECRFCGTRKSPQWRRAPMVSAGATVPIDPANKNSKDKSAHLMVALCQRCASLWRKYGIQWEPIDDIAKKISAKGGRHNKRTVDDELLMELVSANEICNIGMSTTTVAAAASVGIEVPSGLTIQSGQEGSRKKQKTANEPQNMSDVIYTEPPKKKVVEKPPEPPIIPERPRIRELPCAICNEMEPGGDQRLCCRHCRLTVHRNCYGIPEGRSENKWTCDMCANDSSCQISTSYDCVLCPVTPQEQELMEPPRVSHKKKTDREREKERLEREMVVSETNNYFREQQVKGRPLHPREPLKRTSGNNWVHVMCALYIPEIRFGDARLLEPVEGISSLPQTRYSQACKICKSEEGVCVACKHCSATFHVTCAQRQGHALGFEVASVKGSRRDAITVTTLGTESGTATPVVYCKEHAVKASLHPLNEAIEDSPLNALQVYSRTNKQADTSLTGTVRKAATIGASTRVNLPAIPSTGHRNSLSSAAVGTGNSIRSSRVSPAAMTVKSEEVDEDGDRVVYFNEIQVPEQSSKECDICGTDASPLWHEVRPDIVVNTEPSPPVNGIDGTQEMRPLPEAPLINGHTNGDRAIQTDHIDQVLPLPPVEATNGTHHGAPETNGIITQDGESGGDNPLDPERPAANPTIDLTAVEKVNGEVDHHIASDGQPGELSRTADVELKPLQSFRCHKCHFRKLRNPDPPSSPTPSPEMPHLEPDVSDAIEQSSSPPRAVWSSAAPIPSHDQYHTFPPQPAPMYTGPPRLPNGVSHSPPIAPPQLHSIFVGPHAPYRGPAYPHPQQQQEMVAQPHMNGNPPIYHLQRASGGRPANLHYAPPPPPPTVPRSPPRRPIFMRGPEERNAIGRQSSPPPIPRSPRRRPIFMVGPEERARRLSAARTEPKPSPPPRPPSPPRQRPVFMRGPQDRQGPHGPPRPEENPFASPRQASPRESFHGIYGSSRGNYEAPETPPDVAGRNGSWPGGDSALTNGASASPSLRNLLH